MRIAELDLLVSAVATSPRLPMKARIKDSEVPGKVYCSPALSCNSVDDCASLQSCRLHGGR